MPLKLLYIMRLGRYPYRKLPTNFSDEANFLMKWLRTTEHIYSAIYTDLRGQEGHKQGEASDGGDLV